MSYLKHKLDDLGKALVALEQEKVQGRAFEGQLSILESGIRKGKDTRLNF